jgi:hypothetical protein
LTNFQFRKRLYVCRIQTYRLSDDNLIRTTVVIQTKSLELLSHLGVYIKENSITYSAKKRNYKYYYKDTTEEELMHITTTT